MIEAGMWRKFDQLLAKCRDEESLWRVRLQLCDEGGHEWFSNYRPWQWVPLLEDEHFKIDGMSAWGWQRTDRLECFRLRLRATRPQCGAKCRSGVPCRARVAERQDGTLAKRCRLHGGLSTGAKTEAGRLAIAASNRRRAKAATA
jgi:hypothetical protein